MSTENFVGSTFESDQARKLYDYPQQERSTETRFHVSFFNKNGGVNSFEMLTNGRLKIELLIITKYNLYSF